MQGDRVNHPIARGRRERAHSQIQLRVTRRRKAAYVRAAKGKPLAKWMFETCDREADYNEPTQGMTKSACANHALHVVVQDHALKHA
jgi:hypothetical protein